MKYNTPIMGFVIGLLLPLVGMFIVYLVWGEHQSVGAFARIVAAQKGMSAKVVLLGVLINLIPFAYCNIKRLDYTMRGIFTATMLYAMLVVLIKFVW
ncbi:MAG: hypothetical protein ACHQD8_06195 [Chitinophagales bacterium]